MTNFYDANLVLIQSTFVGLLMALSIQVPLRMGVFSFSGIGCYGVAAYGAAILTIRYETDPLVTILLSALVCGVLNLLLGMMVNRLGGLYLGMATVAFDMIVSVVATNGGDLTGGPTGLFGAITDITMTQVVVICGVVVVALALTERGRLGRRVDTVREDPELAAAMGIRVRDYRLASFVVSGVLGGAAGAVNSLLRSTVSPTDIGFSLVVLALTMIIIGGARSWLGALIGAVIFTWLPSVLEVVGQWQTIIYGVIVALAAVYVPRGLVGLATDGWRRLRRRQPADTVAVADDTTPDRELAALENLAQDTSMGRTS
ncbi:branched-chain amino acid ABC transporter permease [Dactylosporangium sp. NPDC005572]|uniref:branched-chain amino acid ABC transporter permease n=1 Tax=Dactylosporangium sp. NPDC005572 TaxID=3156889 RepID=UPI0033A8D228